MRRHPLFFWGFKMSAGGSGEGGPLRRWLRRRCTAAAASARSGSRKPGKQQASAPAAAPAALSLARRSSQESLSAQWQAAAAISAPASSASDDVAAELEGHDWAAQYYGSYGSMTSPALRSPYLPALGSMPAAGAAGEVQAGAASALPSPSLPRKPTSLCLSVAPEPALPGSGADRADSVTSGGTAGEEEAEGPDVAAERARADALWEQW